MKLKIKHGKNTIQSINNTHATVQNTVGGQITGLSGTLEGITLKNLISTEYQTFTINSTDDTTNKTDTSRIRTFNLTQPLQTDKRYLIVYDVLSITDGHTIGTYFKNSNVSGSFQYSVANMNTTGKKIITITPKVEADVFAIYFDKSTDVEKVATFTTPMILEYVEGMLDWNIPFFTGLQSVQNPSINITDNEQSKSTTVTVSDVELYGIGTVRDSINITTGTYQRRFRKIVLDGSEDEVWNRYGDVTDFATKGFYCTMDYELRGKNAISDLFPTGKPSNIQPNATPWDIEAICVDGQYVKMRILGTKASNVAELRTWLSQNPITVVYELSVVPSIEKINIQGNLITYKTTTNFATQSDSINPILKAEVPIIETTDIPNNMILDKLEFSEDIGVNDFTVGKFILPTMKTKIHNDIDVKHGDIFTVYINDTKYHTYEPYEIKKGNMSREITLYSLPYFSLTQNFVPYGTSYTTRSLLLEMQTALNIVIVGFQDIVAVDMPNVKTDTVINLLQAVAMLLESNITINPHGEIVFTKINTTTTHEIAQSQITSISKLDTTDYHITQITGKLSEDDENPIIVGTGANSWNNLTLINPYLTQSVCTTILGSLPQYSGFDMKIFNAPLIKPLDKIKFTYQGVEYIIPVMDITTSYSVGGLVTRIKANVSNANDKVSNYKGSLTTRLEVVKNITSELDTKITVVDGNVSSLINRTDVIEGDVTTVKSQYSQINQTIGEIDLRVGEVQTELGDKVSTDEVISSINLSTEGVKINGDKLLLTGDTIIIGANGEQTLTQFIKDEGENLILNPNFNNGSSLSALGWGYSVSSYIFIDSTYKHEGNTACKLQYTGTSSAIMLSTSSLSISKYESGKTYKVGVWIYVEDKTKLTNTMYLRANGTATGTTSSVIIAERTITSANLVNNQWTQLSFEFTPTQDYTSPKIQINVTGGISAWVTDFTLQEQGGLSQTEMVKILNGAGDGLYLVDGQLLINAEYIQTGTVRADLVRVQLDDVINLIPFNYITMKNGINTDGFNINEDNNGYPFADCELPIYGGGGGSDYFMKPFGYTNITLESGKSYWFTCEYYAVWGNDTKPDDGVGTSTATTTGKYGLPTANNMDIFISNGNFADIVDNGNYLILASVNDFNTSIQIVEREGYSGVYQRGWTRLVGRIDCTESYTGNLWININCAGFDVGDSGWFYLKNLQLVDSSVANESVKLDYIDQVNQKRIELSDGSYYEGIYSVDGIQLIEGTIEAHSDTEKRKFTLDYDGYKLNATTGSDNAFIGESRSRYSYDGGSSGIIDGFDELYGVGATQLIESTSNREGVFVGVHHGFQIPNSTAYGRADIYGYNRYTDSSGSDWTDWSLLGANVEPNALVRRNDNCSIATNGLVLQGDATNTDFSQGGTTYHGSVIFSEPLFSTTSNGQIINIHKDNKRIYFGNPNSDVQIEGSGISIRYGTSDASPVICKANLHDSIYIGAQSSTETGREIKDWGVYSYNLYSKSLTNGDGTSSAYGGYWSILTFGNGQSGSAQLAIDWTSQGKGFYMRSLRDTQDNWFKWKRIGNSDWLLDSTSDERYKRAISDVSTEDCYNMVKNIELHSYLLLTEEERYLIEKGELDVDELFLRTVTSEGIHHNLQMGVLAQDMLKYSCGTYVVNQDVLRDENGELISDRYGIDAYNYASAILGGLQEEIRIRDEQYEELKKENDELKAKNQELEERLARIEAMLLNQ